MITKDIYKIFRCVFFFLFLVTQPLDPDPDSLEMPVPDSQHGLLETIIIGGVRSLQFEDDMCGMVQEAGKYLFPDEASQTALDDNWEHTQLRVVRGKVTDAHFCRSVRKTIIVTVELFRQ